MLHLNIYLNATLYFVCNTVLHFNELSFQCCIFHVCRYVCAAVGCLCMCLFSNLTVKFNFFCYTSKICFWIFCGRGVCFVFLFLAKVSFLSFLCSSYMSIYLYKKYVYINNLYSFWMFIILLTLSKCCCCCFC